MYINGDGVLHNCAQVMRFYCLAAEQGNTDALNIPGVAYREGTDNVLAYALYNLAVSRKEVYATKVGLQGRRFNSCRNHNISRALR